MKRKLYMLLFAAPLAAQTAMPPAAKIQVDYIRDVQPILAQKCYSCHGDGVSQAGLNLKRRQAALRGGDYGPVIVSGKSAESKLIKRLVNGDGGLQMPPTGPLGDEEIAILRAWIDQGVDWRIEVTEDAPPKLLDAKSQALISAVRSDDIPTVRRALEENPAAVKTQDNSRNTLLHHAATYASVAMVKLLVDSGAEVNAQNRRKSTPLHWAIHDEAKVRLLCAHGAVVDAKQVEGRTPLFQAASLPNANGVLRFLLDQGADPNAKTVTGMTPLMTASAERNLEGLQLLLSHKAAVNVQAGNGMTALLYAAGSGKAELVRVLLARGADAKLKTKKGDTALMRAATSGVEESVRLLIEAGSDVNARGERGYTALMLAAASDAMTLGSVKRLLDKGADTTPVADGETAKSLAVMRGDTAIARLLGASDEERSRRGVEAAVNNQPRPVAEAVSLATALLAKQSQNFIRIGGCNSCHAQDLPSVAAAVARNHGLRAPAMIEQLSDSSRGASAERILDLTSFGPSSVGWELLDYGMNRVPGNEYTEAVAHYVRIMQTAAGNWAAPQGKRPPMAAGEQQAAALSIYSMQKYTAAGERDAARQAIAKAAAWLAASQPATTQDRAFQVMGLVWAGADPVAIARASEALAAMQQPDGGWNQLPTMGTDAHASGEALYALALAGMAADHAVYRKGTAYLLRNQAEDGSWHVKTRSIWLQPYFESGFPYGHDQWISAAGTAWASMALSVTRESPTLSRR